MTTHIIDSSVIPSGIVGRFAAERERDIERHAEAQHREEVLLKIEAELKEQTEARRQQHQQRRATVEEDWAPTKIKGPVRRIVCDDHEGFPCPGGSFPQMIECSTVCSEAASEDTIGTNNFKTSRKNSNGSSSSGPGIRKSGPSRRATVETVATEASTAISEQSFQSAWSTLKESALTADSALDVEYTNEFSLRTSVLSDDSLHVSDVSPDSFNDEEDSAKISAPILQKKCKIHEDVELREEKLQMLTEELNALDLSTSETLGRMVHLEKQVDEQGDSVEWLLSSKNKSTSTPPDIEYEDHTDLIEALFADKKNQDETIDVLLKELDEMRLQRIEENTQKSSNDAQFDILKCEIMAMEARRARVMQEKREMEAELHEMRVLLDEANQRAEEAQQRANKKASAERVIYQVSCRKCSKGRAGQMIGTTRGEGEVKHAVRELLKRCSLDVVTSSSSPKKGGSLRSSLTSPLRFLWTKGLRKRPNSVDKTCPEECFRKHLESHIPKYLPKTEKDIYKYCKEIVKVEVLRKNNDEDLLHWRD